VSSILTCRIFVASPRHIQLLKNDIHALTIGRMITARQHTPRAFILQHRASKSGAAPLIHARHKESDIIHRAAIAQLGERQTEDLKVPGSIPGLGIFSNFMYSS
jgi:hypothetical protein